MREEPWVDIIHGAGNTLADPAFAIAAAFVVAAWLLAGLGLLLCIARERGK